MTPSLQCACDAWVRLFEDLAEAGVPAPGELARLAREDVHFRDPFNDLRGLDALDRLLLHTRRTVQDLVFRVGDRAWSGDTVYLRWEMTGRVPVIGPWRVEGLSQVRFDADGRVAEHLDHWDAAGQFYGHLPLVGALLRLIRSRAAVT